MKMKRGTMSALDWEKIGEELKAIRKELERSGRRLEPSVITYRDAAQRLGITETKLLGLIRTRVIMVVADGEIAVSELQYVKPMRSSAMPEYGQRKVPAKTRARLKAASMKRRARR